MRDLTSFKYQRRIKDIYYFLYKFRQKGKEGEKERERGKLVILVFRKYYTCVVKYANSTGGFVRNVANRFSIGHVKFEVLVILFRTLAVQLFDTSSLDLN